MQRISQGRLTIRARLIGGALVVLLLLMISGLVNLWAQSQLDQATSAFQREAERVAAAREVAWGSADLLVMMGQAAYWQDVAYLTETLDTALATLYDVRDGLSEAMADLPDDDEVQVEARSALEHMISLESLAEQMISSAEAEDWVSVEFYETQMLQAYREIAVESLERVVTLTEERQAAAAAVAATARQLATFVPAGFAALALAVTGITIWAAVRSITAPVERLARGATRLAEGHLEERVPAGGRDELGHLAAVFNEMADRIQSSYAQLEERVAERTKDLARRAGYLEATAEVARDAAAVVDVPELLSRVVTLVSDRFGFYHTGIFLLDDAEEYAVLRAASSEGGQRMLARGHKLKVGEVGIVGNVAGSGQPRIALDVGQDAVYFDNPDLAETRSEMALPLKTEEQVIGVLDVQSRAPQAFSEEDVAVLQTLADQVALAIEKARLLDESQRALRELEALHGARSRAAWQVLDKPPAFAYDRVEVTPAAPEPHPAVEQALNGGRVVAMTEPDDGRSALVAPLRLRDQVLGAIALEETDEARPWTEEEIEVVQAVSEQVALALESARLFEETQRRAGEQEGLARIAALAGSTLEIDELLDRLMQEAMELVGAGGSLVLLADQGGQRLVTRYAFFEGAPSTAVKDLEIPADAPGFEQSIFARGGAYYSELGSDDPALIPAYQPYMKSLGVTNFCGVALRVRERSIGELYLFNRPAGFGREQLRLLRTVSAYAAQAIENARLFEETRLRAEELAVLNELAQALTARLTVEEVLEEVYQGASRLLDTTNFYVALYDPNKDEVTFALDVTGGEVRKPYTTRQAGQGITEYIIRNQRPLLLKENVVEWLEEEGVESIGEVAFSWLGVPLTIADRVLGVVAVQSYSTPRIYDERDLDLLTAVASQAAIALQNAYLFEEIRAALTETEKLAEAVRASEERFALAMRGANDGLWDWDIQSSSLYWSPRLKELLGYADDELDVDFDVFESLLHPDDKQHTDAAIEAHFEDRQLYDVEQRLRTKSGEYRWFRARGEALFDEAGKPIRMVGSTTDITERKRSEAERERLLTETEDLAQELAVLNELAQALTARLNLEEVLDEAYRGAARLLDTTNFYVALYDPDRDEVTFALDVTEGEVREGHIARQAGQGVTEHIIRNRAPVLIQEDYAEWAANRGVEVIGQIAQSWLGVPLMVGDRVLGVMAVQSYTTPGLYDEHDRDLLTAVASQTAIAIQNARLFEEAERRATQLAAAAEVARDATAILDVGQLLDETVHLISEQFGFYHAGVFLIDEPGEYAVLQAASSEGGDRMLERGHRLRVGEVGIVGYVAGAGEHRIALDVGADAVFFNNPDLPGTRSEMALPLTVRDRVIGVLDVQSIQEAAFSEEDVAVLRTMADQLATAIENARLFSATEEALEETRELFEASRAIGAATSPSEVGQALMDHVSRAGLDLGRLFLYEPAGEEPTHILMAEGWTVDGRPTRPQGTRLAWVDFPLARLMGAAEEFVSEDVHSDPRVDDAVRLTVEVIQLRSFAVIPLTVGRRAIGGLLVGRDTPYAYPEKLTRNLWTLCGQAAIAIENLRLLEETRRRARELEAINEIGRAITSVLDPDVVLHQIVDITKARFGHDFVGILLVRGDQLVFEAGSTIGDTDRRLERGVMALDVQRPSLVTDAARTGQPVLVNDVLSDPRYTTVPELSATRSELIVPLEVKGRVIGVLDVQSSKPLAYDETDVVLLQSLASQAGVAIENARLFGETEAEAQRRALISEVLQAAATTLEPEDLLHRAGEAISRRLGIPSTVFLWNASDGVLHPVATHAVDATDVPWPGELRVTRSMDPTLFEAVETREVRVLETVAGRLSGAAAALAEQLDVRSALYTPLVSRGQVLGAVGLCRAEGQPPLGSQEVNFAEIVAANLSVVLENARLFQEAVLTAERLAEVDRLKSQFLANMSHELRTPLNSIIGFSRVILKGIDGPLSDLQRQDLEAIYSSGQHLLGLINDILDISRIEAGRMELAFEPVELSEIVSGVMSTAVALVKDKPIELQQSIPEGLPTIMADSRRIRQVLLNLLSNAAKFTDEGFIRVEAVAEEEFITVSVVDTGIGIPKDKLPDVFEAFTQVDASPSRKYGGTGLGLAISKSFVELHGGQIWVKSEFGVGSTFIFTLPIEGPPHTEELKETPDQETPEFEEEEKVGRLVLCVEDDEGVITLFRRYLHKQGYRVVGLTDSVRVVEETKRLKPYAITLDVMMPGKDGWQVIQELKADSETCHVPVIMCTIVSEKGRGMSLGAADYLVKPVLEQDLLAALDRLDREAGRHRILVVDDQSEDRELLRRMIESQEGYEVIEAAGGQEAIALVRQARPHIVVLDLLMPEVDGFSVLEALKADEATRFIPIIVVTAKDLTEEDRRLLNHRIEALIEKGVLEREELLEDVAAGLRKVGRGLP